MRREPADDREARSPPAVEALRLATELGMRPLAARCRLGLATMHEKSGAKDGKARAERDAAVETFRDLPMPHWLGQVETVGAP